MNALIKRLARDAAAPVEQMAERLLKKAALFALAISCLFFASVFLTIALYTFVQTLEGSVIAALGVGLLYLGVGLTGVIIAMRSSARAGGGATDAPTESRADGPSPAFAMNIEGAIAPILDVLRAGGFERERLAVEAGAAIAKQLNPYSVVAFAIVSGFILGRLLGRRDRPSGGAA